MKWIPILLIGTLLLCSSGIVSAANNTTQLTLYTDDNIRIAENTISDSGIGNLFALIGLVVKIVIFITPVVLLAIAIVSLLGGNNDRYKLAIKGFILMVIVLLVYNLYTAFIGSLAPDISTIQI